MTRIELAKALEVIERQPIEMQRSDLRRVTHGPVKVVLSSGMTVPSRQRLKEQSALRAIEFFSGESKLRGFNQFMRVR